MVTFETVRVAAVQATPVILDAEATIDKAIDLVGEAADGGANLVVFPGVLRVAVPERGVGGAGGDVGECV